MGDTALEKTAEELRHEIDELHRQQREITERLRDPRGLRRGGFSNVAPRNQGRRGFPRPAERNDVEDEPPAKRRLSSAVVKVDGEDVSKDGEFPVDGNGTQVKVGENGTSDQSDKKQSGFHRGSWSQRDAEQRRTNKRYEAFALPEPAPRVLPKNEDPKLVNRNRRMLGNLLGTLEKFRKEDKQRSGTDAYARRTAALQRAEEKAREESERLRLQERENLTEKRRRDLTLRARVAAKAEQKKLELLFLQWSEHQKKLSNFIRTKAEPRIYYAPVKPLEEDTSEVEQQKERTFLEWKAARRQEVSEYQKEIEEQCLGNVEKELERWQNARKARKANNEGMNLQETMDKELETHRMEHGPKKRKIPGGGVGDEDEEDEVEDINGGEDEMIMDDLLEEGGDGTIKEEVATDTVKAEAVEEDIKHEVL
ncbi:Pinin/SDK/MemA protein [Arabidopsis suecica]|uniref:Pinin/SDK/MemA protein n=1 Tax=Arabidopsis suecica TaxID=45249 RepID=A0A8T2H5P7_ARASU|nr:Pinin/SDK/MemA protein [Arabidopsis suecica]